MKACVTVWTLAWDTRTGTDCEVFATENELEARLAGIIRDDLATIADREADDIRAMLDTGNIWEAWDRWREKYKDPLDTYNWDSQPLTIEFAETEQPVGV